MRFTETEMPIYFAGYCALPSIIASPSIIAAPPHPSFGKSPHDTKTFASSFDLWTMTASGNLLPIVSQGTSRMVSAFPFTTALKG